MADKSKDYNVKKVSDDSAVAKPEGPAAEGKGVKLLRLVTNGVVLLLVLAVVMLAAYQDGTGFDFLRRWFTYGTTEQADSYAYDAAVNNRFALLQKLSSKLYRVIVTFEQLSRIHHHHNACPSAEFLSFSVCS